MIDASYCLPTVQDCLPCMPRSRLRLCCRSRKRRSSPLVTLDVILRQNVALLWGWSMGVLSEGPWVHPGIMLGMPWT